MKETLTVRRALQRQTGRALVLVEPKSKAGRRTIELPDALRDALRTHRTKQLEQRMAAANTWDGDVAPASRTADPSMRDGIGRPGRRSCRRCPELANEAAERRGTALWG